MNRHRRKFGFSYLEVLFAVFLVGASALIVTAGMPTSTSARMKANYQYKAMGIAEKQLETIRGLGYANCTSSQLLTYGLIDNATAVQTNTYTFSNVDNAVLANPSSVLPSGYGTVELEQVSSDLRSITIIVTWKDRGQTKSYKTGTMVASL